MKKILYIFVLVLIASTISAKDGVKPKLMWLDCSANFARFSYEDSIKYYVDKCHQAGITHLVLDVKGTTGMVLYPSKITAQKKTWKGHTRPDFDFINTFLTEAHSRGMKVYASFNIFADGHGLFKVGEVFGKNKKWQAMNYVAGKGIVPVSELDSRGTVFLNPALAEVQKYEISILEEAATNYNIDGIMLDRARYDRIESDFSPESKKLFETYIGKSVERFPEDIFEWKTNSKGGFDRVQGKYFKEWIEWRASVIYNFFRDTRIAIKKINPNCVLATYTGAWYPSYYEVGVNWASNQYDPSRDYEWATANYKQYAYGELLDFYTNGNYYWNVTLEEYFKSAGKHMNETDSEISSGSHLSVEGACKLSRKLLKGLPFAGGMYVEDYKNDVNQFKKAVKMNLTESDGLMIFDIVHIINRNWWTPLKDAINETKM